MNKGIVFLIGFGFLVLGVGYDAKKEHREMMSRIEQSNAQQTRTLEKLEELLQELKQTRSSEALADFSCDTKTLRAYNRLLDMRVDLAIDALTGEMPEEKVRKTRIVEEEISSIERSCRIDQAI